LAKRRFRLWKKRRRKPPKLFARIKRLLLLAVLAMFLIPVLWVCLYSVLNPPTTITMTREAARLGGISYRLTDIEDVAPFVPLSMIAAEDANFCLHSGFDFDAIREVLEQGESRGASTISQQVAKNAFLWQGRSWVRKGLEAGFTILIELIWSKRRIIEVYLNVAETAEGVFGIEGAAGHYFSRKAARLNIRQASLIAAVLPSPKTRSASRPTRFLNRRARSIEAGIKTLQADGRASCL
jgi:monofunctional biosynthetic peptidoglycan transglycosylase